MKNTKMASLSVLSFTFLVISMASMNTPVGASSVFKVGDVNGWRQPSENDTALYNQWAAKNRFHVGDLLHFIYKNDSVLVVDKWGYFHCNMTNPISTFNNGNTVVNLDKPGPAYFISGDPDHCKNGQRLTIEVMSPLSVSHSPPSISVPPEPYMAASPSPLPSSGESVSATVASSVVLALIATFITP